MYNAKNIRERKHMLSFVVLKHIKLNNLIKQKATNKEQSRMSDQYDNIYKATA